jgi:flagellar hook-associated protein 1 FlgK
VSLGSSLQIGRTALTASQIALQITGNNLANASTAGYSRQVTTFSPQGGSRYGSAYLGRGVQVSDVRRMADDALTARLWTGTSNQSAANNDLALLSQVEGTLNELTDSDLSSELGKFFNSWSELANNPSSAGSRSLVVQQAGTLGSYLKTMRQDLQATSRQIDQQLGASVHHADGLLSEIARVNQQVAEAEAGGAVANDLRDKRDGLIGELSEIVQVSTVEQNSGAVDVLIGSTPVVLGSQSRGLEMVTRQTLEGPKALVSVRANGQIVEPAGNAGTVGSLLAQRDGLVDGTIDKLDSLASQLIFQVNKIHSTGYGSSGLTTLTSTRTMDSADVGRALNDPQNGSLSGLPFAAKNGGFTVTITDAATGATTTRRIDVDLDGLTAAGTPGYSDDTSLADIAAQLDGVPNLDARVNADGTLSISAGSGYTFGFQDDSSDALATLGVNTFFTGEDAASISVRGDLSTNPGLLNAGAMAGDGTPSDNGSALAVAGLRDLNLDGLGGRSISQSWQDEVQSIGMRTDAAKTRADATTLVKENLEAQRTAVSGVNVDEEAINMMTYQRQYQGAARFISVVDDLTQTLINLV